MIISIPKETIAGETRVAATPETVKKFIALGLEVSVESKAGLAAGFSDDVYLKAGAKICSSSDEVFRSADIILAINAPEADKIKLCKNGAVIVAHFNVKQNKDSLGYLAQKSLTCLALDLIPRISRAQSMDVLSSQSNLAGYKAVIKAVDEIRRAVPFMITAGGTVPPAKVLVLGAGVAGLQAIATAKRLGAQVFASDVRAAAKEQVESLGAKFLVVDVEENLESDGGYAKEASKEYQQRQKELVAKQLSQTDIAITTALIPGKKAPILITNEMLKNMPDGAVVVDLASASGGNVEGVKDGQSTQIFGVKVIGYSQAVCDLAQTASELFARNVYNFVSTYWNKELKSFDWHLEDEIIKAACFIDNGVMK